MSLTFTRDGILNTVQDLGRTNYRRLGINPGGVMDRAAARIINILLGNDENEAVIEMHFPAGEIRFDADALIALGGGYFGAEIDSEPVVNWRRVAVSENSSLRFKTKLWGERTYLAVKGGFRIDNLLGSGSTNLTATVGGFKGRRLLSGDTIEFNVVRDVHQNPFWNPSVANSLLPRYSRFPTVRAIGGAELELLTESARDVFTSETFVVSKNSDRMGYRLIGEYLSLGDPVEMISSAVGFGTVQLLPDGQLIVLMADHQTTGGYPRIAHVVERDLPLLAQLGPNDKVAFHFVDIEQAEALLLEFEHDLALLKTGVRLLS